MQVQVHAVHMAVHDSKLRFISHKNTHKNSVVHFDCDFVVGTPKTKTDYVILVL